MIILIAIWTILGGIAFRIRGGMGADRLGLHDQHWAIRSIWAATLCLAVVLTSVATNHFRWQFFAIFPLAYVGTLMGFYGALAMGRGSIRNWSLDAIIMSVRGFVFAGLPAAVFLPTQYEVPIILGFLMPLIYELAWRSPFQIKNFMPGTELGEFLFGALVTFVFIMVIV